VIGARTERYPDLLDICCAITGRVPAVGLHIQEHRAGQLLLTLDGVPSSLQEDDQFFAVFGHLVGKLSEDFIPVIEGVTVRPPEDQLKAFAAAAASSGRVALFHMVGVTPEAPTTAAAFQGRAPVRTRTITVSDLRAARRELTTADGRELDMVILGSPHFSLAEFAKLAPLVTGRRVHPRVKFVVTSSRLMKEQAHERGVLPPILAFGAQVTLDTCILASPMLPPEIKTLMTNSAKYAYYAPSLLNTRVTFGSLADCVASAIEGRVVRDDAAWSGA
jgi:predicted aconitase